MSDGSTDLLGILRIGHETSIRGAGLSLSDALARSHYRERRAAFGPDDLRAVLEAHPQLAEEWFAYSEDKRTGGGGGLPAVWPDWRARGRTQDVTSLNGGAAFVPGPRRTGVSPWRQTRSVERAHLGS